MYCQEGDYYNIRQRNSAEILRNRSRALANAKNKSQEVNSKEQPVTSRTEQNGGMVPMKMTKKRSGRLATCSTDQHGSLHRNASWREVFIVFGMVFGLPITFIMYKNLLLIMNLSEESTSYAFPVRDLDVRRVDSILDRNRQKYDFKYNKLRDIDRRKNLSIEEFHAVYNGKWPVIITDCVTQWKAFKLWNRDYFMKYYAKEVVSMRAAMGSLQQSEHLALTLEHFLDHLDDGYPQSWTYLEDELFLMTHKELLDQVGTCPFLSEDYFELFPKDIRPWWAFMLWGTRFSRSALHIDPYNWTGTNAVIAGLKRWKLYPPGQDHLLNVVHGQLSHFPLDCYKYNSRVDSYDVNSVRQSPEILKARVLEFYQYPGELLIIPPGWFHQAFNEQPTLAISGQLMNRANYRIVLEEIFKAGSLPRDGYDSEIHKWTPVDQVKAVMGRVDEETLEKGRASTEFILNQLVRQKRRLEEL